VKNGVLEIPGSKPLVFFLSKRGWKRDYAVTLGTNDSVLGPQSIGGEGGEGGGKLSACKPLTRDSGEK